MIISTGNRSLNWIDMFRIKDKLNKKEIRLFFPVVGTALIIIAVLLFIFQKNYCIIGSAGLAFIIIPFLSWKLMIPLYFLWLCIAKALGTANTYVLMFIVFFIAITPIGLIMRLFGKSPIRKSRNKHTFWLDKPEISSDIERYKKQH